MILHSSATLLALLVSKLRYIKYTTKEYYVQLYDIDS